MKPYKGNYTNGYMVEGHADYAVHGQDIVCAAVSVLTQTCLESLKRYTNIEAIVEPGNMQVDVTVPNVYTQVLISSMLNGLTAVANSYTHYLHIEKEQSHDKNTRI